MHRKMKPEMSQPENGKKKWLKWVPSKEVLLLIMILYIMILFLFKSGTRHFQTRQKIREPSPKAAEASKKYLKTILLWTSFFGDKYGLERFLLGKDRESHDTFLMIGCPHTSCMLTSNRSLLANVSLYDAIVFHQRDISLTDLPPPEQRKPQQTYVHLTLESPANEHADKTPSHKLNGLFNSSFSYRADADFPAPYGRFIKTRNHPAGEMLDKLINSFGKNNTNLATKEGNGSLQMVSNCNSKSGREDLVKLIQKLIPVDVYGQCGPLKCKRGSPECTRLIERNYKFYLSFENSICKDYVTEKFFKILPYNTIPVVFNGANMREVAPPHSYINVMDYRSVTDLVKDMKRIADDDAVFASYFWWRDFYRIQGKEEVRKAALCKMCETLHKTPVEERYMKDLESYWKNEAKCSKPSVPF